MNQIPRVRPHQAKHTFGRRDVGDDDEFVGEMLAQPGKIALQGGAWNDGEEGHLGKPRHGEIALDATLAIQHLCVDDFARRHVHVVGAEALQEGQRVAAFYPDFAERGHVEQADAVADGEMFVALVAEPVLPLPGIAVLALLALPGEPVGALPAGDFAEHGAARLQVFVQGRAPDVTGRRHLSVRKMVGVEQAECFGNAFLQIAAVLLEGLGATDVDLPKIERGFTVIDPLRQRHAGAARRDDADRIVAGGHPVAR